VAVQDVQRLLTDIVSLHALQSGHLQLRLGLVDLRAMVQRLAQQHRHMAHVSIHWHVDAAVPLYIISDGLRLQQAAGNGLSNACRATSTGEIRITVFMEHVPAQPAAHGPAHPTSRDASASAGGEVPDASVRRQVVIHVDDTGPGFGGECCWRAGGGGGAVLVLPTRPISLSKCRHPSGAAV
jgi:signal transduction histidine kinase